MKNWRSFKNLIFMLCVNCLIWNIADGIFDGILFSILLTGKEINEFFFLHWIELDAESSREHFFSNIFGRLPASHATQLNTQCPTPTKTIFTAIVFWFFSQSILATPLLWDLFIFGACLSQMEQLNPKLVGNKFNAILFAFKPKKINKLRVRER